MTGPWRTHIAFSAIRDRALLDIYLKVSMIIEGFNSFDDSGDVIITFELSNEEPMANKKMGQIDGAL